MRTSCGGLEIRTAANRSSNNQIFSVTVYNANNQIFSVYAVQQS